MQLVIKINIAKHQRWRQEIYKSENSCRQKSQDGPFTSANTPYSSFAYSDSLNMFTAAAFARGSPWKPVTPLVQSLGQGHCKWLDNVGARSQVHQSGQAPGGQVAGAQSGGNFVLGEDQANPEMPSGRASRGSSGEVPNNGGVPGAELVQGCGKKMWWGLGRNLGCWPRQNPNPHDLDVLKASDSAPALAPPEITPEKMLPYQWKMLTINHLLAMMQQSGSVTRKATNSLYIALMWVSCWLVLTAIFRRRHFMPLTFPFFFFFPTIKWP